MQKFDKHELTVRSCASEDLEHIVDYTCNCSEEFLRSFGADKKKVPPKDVFIQNLQKNLDQQGVLRNYVIVYYQNRRVGHYLVNNFIETESAVFHGQIWDEELRGIGLGPVSAALACVHFFAQYNFNKIIFKVPKINGPANKAIQRCGLPILGTVIYEFALMIEPIECYLYEVERWQLDQFMARV